PTSLARSSTWVAPASFAPPKMQRAADQGICRVNREPSLPIASNVKSSALRVPRNVPPSSPLPEYRPLALRRSASIIFTPSSLAGFSASHPKLIVPPLDASHCQGIETANGEGSCRPPADF